MRLFKQGVYKFFVLFANAKQNVYVCCNQI